MFEYLFLVLPILYGRTPILQPKVDWYLYDSRPYSMSLLKGFKILLCTLSQMHRKEYLQIIPQEIKTTKNFTEKSGNFGKKSLAQHAINIKHFTKH